MSIKNLCGGHRRAVRRAMLSITTILASGFAVPAMAQVEADVPPVASSVDENGIDMVSRKAVDVPLSVAIGPDGAGSVSYHWGTSNEAQSAVFGFITVGGTGGTTYTVTIGGSSETFLLTGTLGSGGTFSQQQGRGSTLTYNGTSQVFTYTAPDGSVATFSKNLGSGVPVDYTARILTLEYPAGEKLSYVYKPKTALNTTYNVVTSVTSNLGYQLRLTWTSVVNAYPRVTDVVVFNMLDETCDPAADSCALTGSWPSITMPTSGTATDNIGRSASIVWTANGSNWTQTVTYPSSRQKVYTLSGTDYRVLSYVDGADTWTYTTYYPQSSPPVSVATSALGDVGHALTFEAETGRPISTVAGPVLPSTQYTYGTDKRLSKVQVSRTDVLETNFTYDGRGNVAQTSRVSITPGTPANIVTSASYPSSCTQPKICNAPTYSIDANGKQTDYTYDPAHGGLLTVTLPADANGIRPQTRYTYTALTANYRNPSGTIVQGSPVYRVTSISSCRTTASCAGTADEVKTTIQYGANDGLLPVSKTVAAGDNSLGQTWTMTYTRTGDLKTVDGPLSGSDDTTRYYYDGARRPTGEIGPDPDGAGPLLRGATRTTYNGEGQVTLVETGTATDQSDTGMSTFVAAESVATVYDSQGREVKESAAAGGTTYAVTQYSYTNLGLLDCVAERMNPAIFASLPASACTLGTQGSYGADRITKYIYDAYRRLTEVRTGFGTSAERAEVTNAYGNLSNVVSVTDAEGNKTTTQYDGFLRPWKTFLPSTTKGNGTSSTTDYVQIDYDPADNVLSRRLRDGQVIGYGFDNLGRMTSKNLPGSELDVTYGYDLFGHLTSASTSAQTLSFGFNALGQNTSQGQAAGTVSYQYDAGGRRTRMTWPDGTYMAYDYRVTGELAAIRENGATSGAGVLDTFSYDTLGRRASITRGNGTVTTYGYDSVSRLTSIAHDVSGTTNDVTLGYSYSPAGQITSETRTNDLYAWGAHYNVNRGYGSDGLNRVTSAGAVTPTYDARGNLTNDGTNTYTYDSENHLVSVSGALTATLEYDPIGRLSLITTPTNTIRELYDGDLLISDHTPSTGVVGRRFVKAPGDEILLWYLGATLGAPRAQLTDIRGSVIASTNSSGTVNTISSYDEYGIPGTANNTGRFQYTGQMWLSEVGLYYYKARMYSPTLGRFMQTDPIGYADGMNWYAYVGNDPVNKVDPSGMDGEEIVITGRIEPTVSSSPAVNIHVTGFDRRGPAPMNYMDTRRYAPDPTKDKDRLAQDWRRQIVKRIVQLFTKAGKIQGRKVVWKSRTHSDARLKASGINPAAAEAAVAQAISKSIQRSGVTSPGSVFRGQVSVDGQWVGYRAMILNDGSISVGTIYKMW